MQETEGEFHLVINGKKRRAYNVKQAAEYIGVTYRWMRDLMDSGKINYYLSDGKRYITQHDLDKRAK